MKDLYLVALLCGGSIFLRPLTSALAILTSAVRTSSAFSLSILGSFSTPSPATLQMALACFLKVLSLVAAVASGSGAATAVSASAVEAATVRLNILRPFVG